MAENILLNVHVSGDQAVRFFPSLAAGAQQAATAITGIGPAFAGVAQGIQALQQLEKARQAALGAGAQELQILQQQIAIQQQAQAGVLSLSEATRKLAEAEILAKTGSQQLATELVAARTLHQQNAAALQAEAAAQQALQAAQVSAKAEIAELQQKAAIQKQVLAGTISLEQGTRKLAEAEILAKTGSQQLATQLAALRVQTERNATAMRQLSAASIQIRAAFQSLSSAAGAVGFIGGLAGAALLTKQLVTDGLAVAQAYESSSIAIAALLQGTTNLVDAQGKIVDSSRSWQANLRESARLQNEIAGISAQTLGTDQELIGVFRSVLAFSRGQTGELNDQLKVARGLVNLAKLQGFAGQEIEDKVRQIFQLQDNQIEQFLTLIGLSFQEAQLMKQKGLLTKELIERLAIYNVLAGEVANTWEGLITSVETFRNLTAKEAFSETFVGLKEILKGMAGEFDRLRTQGGFAAALGADAAQLQDLGRSLADIMVSLEIVVAGTVNAFLTLAAQFNDTADGAQHADKGLQALADTFSGGLQQSVAGAARVIAGLVEDFKVFIPLIGLVQGALVGGLPGAIVGGAAGLAALKVFNEQMDAITNRLTTFANRVDASTQKTADINAEINKFATLATDASVGVDVHQFALSALNETMDEAEKAHVGLTAENRKLVESLAKTDAGFKRVGLAMLADADLLKTQAKLVSDAAKEYANLQLRMADITGNVTLFRATKEAEILRQQTEEIKAEQLKGVTDMTAINEKYATRLQALTLDTTDFVVKEEKRKTEVMLAEVDSRLATQRAADDSVLSALSKEIEQLQALQEQAKRAGASQAEMSGLIAATNQTQATFHAAAVRASQSDLVLMREKLGLYEKERAALQARAALVRGKGDDVSLANLRQLNDAIQETTLKISAQEVEIKKARDAVAGAQADIATTKIQRGEGQLALTQLYLDEEAKRTQFSQEGAQQRADIELQGIQQRMDAITNQQGLETATLRLREAQGAGLEELADREQSLIELSQRRGQEAIRTAEIELRLQQGLLDIKNETIAAQQQEFGAAFTAGDIASANDLALSIEKAKLEAGGLALEVEKSKGALDNAKVAAVALGIDGAAATAKLRHELELSRAVLTTNDARNIFSDILDAGSFKKAGKILEKESKDLSKRIFEDLIFGKKGSFDEPLISNVNSLFGSGGDVGLLGKIMGAGGKVAGDQFGKAATTSSQQTLQTGFPTAAQQATAAAQGVFLEQGQASGKVFGDNCLSGFEGSFGKGIGGVIDGILRLFSSGSGGTGGSGGGGSSVNFGGLFDMFGSMFGSAGGTSATSFNSGFMGNFGQGFGDLGSTVDASSVNWSAAGSSSGSAFGGGFMDTVGSIFGGAGGGGGGGIMGLFGGSGGAGGAGTSGASSAGSWFGLGLVASQAGKDFSQGNYGAGSGAVVGGALGAYFSMGDPQMTAAAAALGAMIGKIFDDVFNKQGRIDKEKVKIISYFEKVFDIDFKQISEKKAAAGLAAFADATPAAIALGAIFSEGLKKGDLQGSSIRFAGQLLGNLKRMGDGADEVKEKLLKLADAANFDLKDSIQQINAFTQASGADALTLNNFQEELKESKKNLKEYTDIMDPTVKELNAIAAAHGNTGSQIVTYIDLIGGAIDISTRFNEFLDGQQIAQGLAANAFEKTANAAGSLGERVARLAGGIREGNLSLEEAALELNRMREAAGQAKLSLDDLTIDPKKLELIVTVLQSATEGLQNFSAGLTDVLASGLGQKLDEAGAGARFEEFMNATLRVAVTKAMIGGLIDGLKVEVLKPFFTALGAEFTALVTGAIDADEFGRRMAAIKAEFAPAIAAAKAGFIEVDKTVRDVLTSLGLWPNAVDDTTDSLADTAATLKDVQDKIKAIDDQLLDIARRKIHVEIDLAAKLESIGAITLLEKLDIESEGLQAEFDLLTAKLNAMGTAAGLSVEQLGEAISLVQQLAANVVAKFQAEKAAIEAALKTEIDAIRARGEAAADAIRAQFAAQRAAIEARIDNLEKEKDLINEAFDARRDALEKELQLAEEFQRVGESIQQTINQLVTSNIAPQSPFAQLSFLQRQAAQIRGQLDTARPEDVPALMQQLTALLQQMAQLQTPNSRPSPEFQALFNSILLELEALRDQALAQGSQVETLQEELRLLDIERNVKLDAIDAQIEAARTQLDGLSALEQAALAAAAAGIEAEIAAAQARADAKIEELRVTAEAELRRLAVIEQDLLSRQEAVLLSERDILMAQLTELGKLNITAADLLRITYEGNATRGNTNTVTNEDFRRIPPPDGGGRGNTPPTGPNFVPQFLADSMQVALQTPPTRHVPDIARPERIQTASTRTESTRPETEAREVKLVIEGRFTVDITGAHNTEDAVEKTKKAMAETMETKLREFARGDYFDKAVRDKARSQIRMEVRN